MSAIIPTSSVSFYTFHYTLFRIHEAKFWVFSTYSPKIAACSQKRPSYDLVWSPQNRKNRKMTIDLSKINILPPIMYWKCIMAIEMWLSNEFAKFWKDPYLWILSKKCKYWGYLTENSRLGNAKSAIKQDNTLELTSILGLNLT